MPPTANRPIPPSSTCRRAPATWFAVAALLAATACGPAEDTPPAGEQGTDTRGAQRANGPRGARGAKGAGQASERPKPPAPWKPPQPVEVVELPKGELPTLFADRIPPVADAVRAHIGLFETGDTNWPTESTAERAEAELERIVRALLATDSSAEAAGGAKLSARVAASGTFTDGAARVARWEAAEPASEAFASVFTEVRTAIGSPDPEITVLVTSIDSAEDPRTGALCVISRREAADPAQASIEFEAEWTHGASGELELRSLAIVDLELVSLPRPMFAEITPSVLAAEDYYDSQILRGVDDYFMRIDRQGGTAFQGMQGLAVGDVNGDGREDIYVCQQVGIPNRLLIRNADGTATDSSGEAKVRFLDVTRAALIVDLDGDSHSDLVLAVGPTLLVAYNDGTGVFNQQLPFQAEGQEQIYNLSAADADGDGDLDIYAGRYALEGVMHGVPTPYHDAANGSTNSLWRNLFADRGERAFEDATAEAGLDVNNTQFTLSSVWDDFDEDGDLDLYVVNDFGRNNLYRNDGSGHFEDVAEQFGALDIGAGMGATVGDYDGDGDQDLYVTNMFSAPGMRITAQAERFMDGDHPDVQPWYAKHARGNSLLRNRGDGSFEDVTDTARVALARWAWGGLFTDFNNDGLDDLYVPCGHATRRGAEKDLEAFFWHRVISSSPPDASPEEEYAAAFSAVHRMVMYEDYSWSGEERNLAYLNTGGARFADVSSVSGLDWADDSRSAALIDWDEDGRVDVLLKNRNAPRLRILRNQSPSQAHWIAFELEAVGPNTDAIGARVEVTAQATEDAAGTPGRKQSRRIHAGDGYLAQSSPRPHFGLGAATEATVRVTWPDGSDEAFGQLAADRRWRLVQGTGEAESAAPPSAPPAQANATSAWNPEPVVRVPLAARLPMAPFSVPSFERPERRVADLFGAPCLIVLYDGSKGGAGAAALSGLAARAADFNRIGLRVVPLATDQGPELAKARQLAERYGLEEAGYADGRVLETFEMIFLEVLGYFRAPPSPVALLLDPGGNLCVLYAGPPKAEAILADLEIMRTYSPGALGTGRFGGGRWLVRRGRDFASMGHIFTARGHPEIGQFLSGLPSVKR